MVMPKSRQGKNINLIFVIHFFFCLMFFSLDHSLFGSEMIRAGTIEIASRWTVSDQGLATYQLNLTQMNIVESIKIHVVFKKARENERIRVYELERAEIDFKYEWSGNTGLDNEAVRIELKSSSPLQAKLKRELNPSECKLELFIDNLKNTYWIRGYVAVLDVPFSAKEKFMAELKGGSRHEETISDEWSEDLEEEIDIEGQLDPEKKHVLKGKSLFYGAQGEFVEWMTSFYEAVTGGDVESSLSWDIRVPMVEIYYWEKDVNDWKDVTSKTQDVLVGEKIKIKAKVLPESANVQDGEWEIEGEIIKDYQASESRARMQPIDSGDLKNPNIDFYWRDGAFQGNKSEAIYTAKVEGEEVSGKSIFNVFRPEAMTNVRAAGNVKIASIADKPGEQGACEILPGPPGIAIDTEIQMPGKFEGHPFRFQYVQLIKTNAWVLEKIGHPNYEWKKETSDSLCLDESYPYTSKKRMEDHPGCPLSGAASAYVQMEMETYIMFLPGNGSNSEENIWIPLKRVSWGWKGTSKSNGDPYRYPQPPCEERFMVVSSETPSDFNPEAENCVEHPEWTCCQKGYDWIKTRIVIQNPDEKPPGWKDR